MSTLTPLVIVVPVILCAVYALIYRQAKRLKCCTRRRERGRVRESEGGQISAEEVLSSERDHFWSFEGGRT